MSCSWLALGLSLIFLPWLEAQHETVCQEMMPQTDNRTNEEVSWSLRDVCCNGYEGTPGHCRPRCNPGCVNAHCTAPQQCTCDLGYETLDDREFSYAGCQPKCRTCRNGNCISPGRCRCWPGYKMSRESLSCQPVPHLLQPAEQCIPNCRSNCWQKHFSWSHKFPVTPKCSPLCTQNQTESCLQLNRCICNSLNQRLICQDLSAKLPQQYVCSDSIKIHRGSQTESLLGGKLFDQTTTTYLSDHQTSIIQTFETNITEPTYQTVYSTDHEDHSVNIKPEPIKQQDYDQTYRSTGADTRDQSINKQYDHAYPSVGLQHDDDSDQSADIQRIYNKDPINPDKYDQTYSSTTNQSDIAPLIDVREELHLEALTIERVSKGDQLGSLDQIDQTVAIDQSDPSTITKVPSIDMTLINDTSLLEELQRIFLINPSNRTDQENATFTSYQMNLTALDQDYQWIADAIREVQQHELNQTNSMDYIDEIDVRHHYDMMNVSKGDNYNIMDSKHNSLIKYLIDPIDPNDLRYKIDSVKILDKNSLQKQSHHIFSSDTTTIDDSDDVTSKGELHNTTLIASLVVFTVITLIIIVIVGIIAVRNRARSPVQTYYAEYFV